MCEEKFNVVATATEGTAERLGAGGTNGWEAGKSKRAEGSRAEALGGLRRAAAFLFGREAFGGDPLR